MDYGLIKGFCHRYALKPLVFHDKNCFTAEMIGCTVDVGPCPEPKKQSGRQRVAAIMYLPFGTRTTEDLNKVKTLSMNSVGSWGIGGIGKLTLNLQTYYTVRNHIPSIRLEVRTIIADPYGLGSRYGFCWANWDWEEPEAIAARDVILGREPPEAFLDWLQERDFSMDSPVWNKAMASLVETLA